MNHCMKRRLLFAASQTYQPEMEVHGREVGWIDRPIVVRREAPLGHRSIDLALIGRTAEGVVVAFRGTLPPFFGGKHDGWAVLLDWMNAGLSICVRAPEYKGGVHLGVSDSMRRLWNDFEGKPGVASAIRMMLARGTSRHLFVTGHSKGGALANLCAYRLATAKEWADMPISVATIAAARAGDAAFAKAYAATRIACLRYEMPGDLVPQLPPGPNTPGWIRTVARELAPELTSTDYHPVGTRVSTGAAHKRWAGSRRGIARLFDRRGPGLEMLMPSTLSAHAICPRSGYDELVCAGEENCSHGR